MTVLSFTVDYLLSVQKFLAVGDDGSDGFVSGFEVENVDFFCFVSELILDSACLFVAHFGYPVYHIFVLLLEAHVRFL
jgi:hypothetical protein